LYRAAVGSFWHHNRLGADVIFSGARFICDDHCGRLARWLRFLGFDCLYQRDIDDHTLLRRATDEQRTILTKDHALAERALARTVVLIVSPDSLQQLAQVIDEQNLTIDSSRIGTRCSMCNGLAQPVPLEQIAERIPPYVRKTQTAFRECEGCHRIYWAGTHVQRMLERLRTAGIIPSETA
jgi:uncharacterized protein with PIN domain